MVLGTKYRTDSAGNSSTGDLRQSHVVCYLFSVFGLAVRNSCRSYAVESFQRSSLNFSNCYDFR